jgi:diaminohydroxyphosphoribosylaminopyrimidine deaminase/5-amino-6-(5-phosphoribosylamino)uracil reductase
MIGVGTALADDPMLTCRLPGMEKNSPVRILLDGALRLPVGSRLVRTARDVPVWVIAGAEAPRASEQALAECGVTVLRADGGRRPALAAVAKLLASQGITRLLVEGGPTLAESLIEADLVDELILLHSAKIIGRDGTDAFDPASLALLTQRLQKSDSEAVGADRCDMYLRT